MAIGHSVLKTVFTGRNLPLTGTYLMTEGFPLGSAWRKLWLRLNVTFTNSSGTGAIADGATNFLKNLNLYDSAGNYRFKNMPGRALAMRANVLDSTPITQSTVTTTGATVSTILPLHFSNPMNIVPDDTVFNTYGLQSVSLQLQLGTIADLLGTVGDGAITAVTMDCYAEQAYGIWPSPTKAIQEVSMLAPALLASVTELNFERSNSLYLSRLFFDTRNSATAAQGFSGTAANTILSDISLESDKEIYLNKLVYPVGNAKVTADYNLPSAITGLAVHDFIRGGSLTEMLWTGDKSMLRAYWTNGTLSNSQLSVVQEGIRRIA